MDDSRQNRVFTGAIGGKNSFPKPLPKEEEEKYLALAAKGDKAAKDVLIRHNMRLVAHIVKNIRVRRKRMI